MPNVKAAWLWLLLAVWLTYSAAMLWNMKVNAVGATAMCHYVPPK